mmetsp:Transcript_12166/g.29057  ORF Transcript_12166/g.29057 Transcript_12166/m.29057 type:complete len:184 (-) Transcript_12166:110-661(-)|eukprot:CAMPEP_0177718612 /NCGR_PEP_ID=MMETSP0484_2-20121128/15667_1 /TAXON_ID=354590 /ORGANISM="Rhodomonas lens, Strain RHODO" /LENGTH=183 /DNA_ID=CAMNT_0019230783 /DNA_START=38 /DNA_END=589 /DNA_ORIENTATION=+
MFCCGCDTRRTNRVLTNAKPISSPSKEPNPNPNNLAGIGVVFKGRKDHETLTISGIVPGGPAHKDGQLQTGDSLVLIDGQKADGLKYEDLARKILGPPGSWIQLVVQRQNMTIEVNLQRGQPPGVPVPASAQTAAAYTAKSPSNQSQSSDGVANKYHQEWTVDWGRAVHSPTKNQKLFSWSET